MSQKMGVNAEIKFGADFRHSSLVIRRWQQRQHAPALSQAWCSFA
jgi:hypothetical protein